jgi:hypothetical protein
MRFAILIYVPLLWWSLFFISVCFVAKGQFRRRYGSISSVCKEVRKSDFLSLCLLLHMLANWTICTSVRSLSLCVYLSVSLSLSQLGWNVLKWNHFGLTFYLCILQCWSSNAILRILEICEFIGQLEDVSEESGSMLVVQLGSLLVVDICTEDVCSFTIWAPSC